MLKGTKEGMKPMSKVEEAIFLGSLILISALWGVVMYKAYYLIF